MNRFRPRVPAVHFWQSVDRSLKAREISGDPCPQSLPVRAPPANHRRIAPARSSTPSSVRGDGRCASAGIQRGTAAPGDRVWPVRPIMQRPRGTEGAEGAEGNRGPRGTGGTGGLEPVRRRHLNAVPSAGTLRCRVDADVDASAELNRSILRSAR